VTVSARRGWALDRVAGWLRSGHPALVVTGSAGTGKSALIRQLVTTRTGAAVHAVHRCRGPVWASTDPVRVLAGIAGRLTGSVPGYGIVPAHLEHDEWDGDPPAARRAVRAVLDSPSPSTAFHAVLSLPFASPAIGPAVVVVDGLDEAPVGQRPAGLVDLFAARLGTDLPGVRLVLTVRSGPGAARLSTAEVIDLDRDRPADCAEIRRYLDRFGALTRAERTAIAAAAAGCPLYAEVAVRLHTAGVRVAGDPPPGLDALYGYALAAVGDPDSLPRLLLALLARSRDAGLGVRQLAELTGVPRAAVTAALRRSRRLLAGAARLRPHHRRLAELIWAATPDPGAVDRLLAAGLARAGPRRAASRSVYLQRNLLAHQVDAARADPSTGSGALRHTINDCGYLVTALLGVGVDDVLSTLTYVRQRVPAPVPDVATVAAILRRQAPALRHARGTDDPVLAHQQLVYEAATTGAPRLARGFADGLPGSAILTLWATGDSPARLLPHASAGHRGEVTGVMVTPDGTRAVSTATGAARVWRLASGRVVHTLRTTDPVSNLHTAGTGAGHVVASGRDGRAQVWDVDTGTPVAELAASATHPVTAFATDSTGRVAVGGDLDGHATIWDRRAGAPIRRLPAAGRLIQAVAMTPDGATAATATIDGDVVVWDLTTGQPRTRLASPAGTIALALSPTADRLLVAGAGLWVYALDGGAAPRLLARLYTYHRLTAVAVNPAMPAYAVIGGAAGQVAYLRLPVTSPGWEARDVG